MQFNRILLPSKNILTASIALRSARPSRILLGHAHPRLLMSTILAGYFHYGTIAHGSDFLAAQNKWHGPLFNVLLRKSRPLITHSQPIADRLKSLGVCEPVVIHPGVDRFRFKPSETTRHSKPVILTVGRLVARKGIDTVIRSIPNLLSELPDLEYRIGGEGPDRPHLEKLASELGIRHAVSFLGRVEEEALPGLYRDADIFVMPVREDQASIEGFGMVFLEASASGLPVIAGRSGGAVEAVRDGETGILIEPDNVDQLAAAILELFINKEKRIRLGNAGRIWVETEMNWDQTAARIAAAL